MLARLLAAGAAATAYGRRRIAQIDSDLVGGRPTSLAAGEQQGAVGRDAGLGEALLAEKGTRGSQGVVIGDQASDGVLTQSQRGHERLACGAVAMVRGPTLRRRAIVGQRRRPGPRKNIARSGDSIDFSAGRRE